MNKDGKWFKSNDCYTCTKTRLYILSYENRVLGVNRAYSPLLRDGLKDFKFKTYKPLKRLFLTSIKRVLTEEAQKRLDAFEDGEDEYDLPKDEYGRNSEWYTEAGLTPPADLINKSSNFLKFDLEEDYETYEVDVTINMKDFEMAVEDEEGCSTIYLKSGKSVFVLEDNADINAQIWWNTRSIWERIREYLQEIKSKIIKSNKQNGVK